MWHLNHITAENFISFAELDLEIPQHGCSLIYGINKDNAAQKNNGTGKSSLTEAIAFALTGEPLRDVSRTEEIINDSSDYAYICAELKNDYDSTTFKIERTIYRQKSKAQEIKCAKYDADGNEIALEITTQATVNDYDRYILSEIGISKEDIYNNFILCNTHYTSFFNASDKAKKTLINHFSGADVVDDCIEEVDRDMGPVSAAKTVAEHEKIKVEERLRYTETMIDKHKADLATYLQNKKERIRGLEQKIVEKREEKYGYEQKIESGLAQARLIDDTRELIKKQEEDNGTLRDTYNYIVEVLQQSNVPLISNYMIKSDNVLQRHKDNNKKLTELKERSAIVQAEFQNIETEHDKARAKLVAAQKTYDDNKKAWQNDIDALEQEVVELKGKVAECDSQIKENWSALDSLNKRFQQLNAILHGKITCPKCQHEFFIDQSLTVGEVETELKTNEDSQKQIHAETRELNVSIQEYTEQIEAKHSNRDKLTEVMHNDKKYVDEASQNEMEIASRLSRTKYNLAQIKADIEMVERELERDADNVEALWDEMFKETYNKLETAAQATEVEINRNKNLSEAASAAIEAFRENIEEVKQYNMNTGDDLEKQKAEHEAKLAEVTKLYKEACDEYDTLAMQKQFFIEFRSYLANQKIDAISAITNHFLELIGSDIRVELSGFKVLRTGKVKDKITVNLLRNGMPCGSFGRYSGGEKARVNLASILGLQKLINHSAPKGKGLHLLILDEILEAGDVSCIEQCCKALNDLKVTSLLVTQQVAADYDGKTILVTKEHGYSTLSNG